MFPEIPIWKTLLQEEVFGKLRSHNVLNMIDLCSSFIDLIMIYRFTNSHLSFTFCCLFVNLKKGSWSDHRFMSFPYVLSVQLPSFPTSTFHWFCSCLSRSTDLSPDTSELHLHYFTRCYNYSVAQSVNHFRGGKPTCDWIPVDIDWLDFRLRGFGAT